MAEQDFRPVYLGKKTSEYRGMDAFQNPGVAIVRMTSDEVTSLCPITGQPDFEVVDIIYAPRELCIESKALKLFLASLRDTPGFVESLSVDIAGIIAEATECQWVRVNVTQKPRGGISIVSTAVLHRNGDGTYLKGTPLTDVAPPHNFYLGY